MKIKIKKSFRDLIMHMAANNPPGYNHNKCLEECVELQEVVIKLQTKHPNNPSRPEPEAAIGEYGDVIYRGLVDLLTIFPDEDPESILDEVSNHITKKLSKLEGYLAENKYKGGL